MTFDFSFRTTFDEVAKVYDEVRPGYPDELFSSTRPTAYP